MFGILVRFELKDETAARGFDALVEDTLTAIQALEPDTLMYAVHTVEDAPLSRVFYELYESRAAHRQHESGEHMKRFHAELNQYLESVRVEFLDSPSGKVF
jgi:quinol monooxygenase YgiN